MNGTEVTTFGKAVIVLRDCDVHRDYDVVGNYDARAQYLLFKTVTINCEINCMAKLIESDVKAEFASWLSAH